MFSAKMASPICRKCPAAPNVWTWYHSITTPGQLWSSCLAHPVGTHSLIPYCYAAPRFLQSNPPLAVLRVCHCQCASVYTRSRELRNCRLNERRRKERDPDGNRRIWGKLVFCVTFHRNGGWIEEGDRYFCYARKGTTLLPESNNLSSLDCASGGWYNVASAAVATAAPPTAVRPRAPAPASAGFGRAIHVPGKV